MALEKFDAGDRKANVMCTSLVQLWNFRAMGLNKMRWDLQAECNTRTPEMEYSYSYCTGFHCAKVKLSHRNGHSDDIRFFHSCCFAIPQSERKVRAGVPRHLFT